MGTHRSATKTRGISKGPLIALAVALVVVAAFGWFQFQQRSGSQAGCSDGSATLAVTVDPAIAASVHDLAEQYNATEPVVRDQCANVTVTEQPSAAVAAALTSGDWDPGLGPQPGLWIPDSQRTAESARTSELLERQPTPLATSPIVLAVSDELRRALDDAGTTWAELPDLQQGSLGRIGLDGWGGLKLALPDGDSSLAVATTVAATIAGSEPLTEEAARSGQAVAAVSGLADEAPASGDTAAALSTIGSASAADAEIHAVPVTQRELDAHGGATAFVPTGAGPVADYPAATISGPWVDKTQNLIAGLFTRFLSAPERAGAFAAAGFTAPPPPTTEIPPRAALDAVRGTMIDPVLGVSATALVDVSASMSTEEGVSTRMTNTIGALASTVNVMPPSFGLGVRTFGKNLDGGDAYRIDADTELLTDDHRTEVMNAVGTVSPTVNSGDEGYAALLAAYRAAIENYSQDRTNSILLITDGPEDDSDAAGRQLLSELEQLDDPAAPVRVDVVAIDSGGSTALRTLAERTNGSYVELPTSDNLQFGTAIVDALTTP